MNDSLATPFAAVMMAGYFALAFVFDALLPRHRAVLATLLTGFLFLPSVEYDLGGALYWNRTTAPVLTVWIGILIRDQALLARLRPRLADLPLLAWCLAPGFASLSNGFPLYDAASGVFYRSIQWAGPYLIGRLHFDTREKLLDLARGAVIGCVVYVPLCLYEILFSPQFHLRLYGFHQHFFFQSIRGSLYRPLVFLQHGLMTTMWLATGAILAWALHLQERGRRFLGVPMPLIATAITATLIASQSMGATVLFLIGAGALWFCHRSKAQWPLVLLAAAPMLWVSLRLADVLTTDVLTESAATVSVERAASFEFRLATEDLLVRHVAQQPLFGWSSWDRDRVVEIDYREQALIVDGLWIIALSQNGYFGLLALLTMHLAPLIVVLRRAPFRIDRGDRHALLLGAVAIIIAITMLDHLVNAMVTPYAILLLGAAPALALAWTRPESSTPAATAPSRGADPGRPRVLGG